MRVANWNVKPAEDLCIAAAMDLLEECGKVVEASARARCPVGTISHGVYKTGKYAGRYWTARAAGALRKTIRTVRKYGDPNLNVWVMAGDSKVYYAQIVEFQTPFLRPALAGSKTAIKTIISNGTTAKGGTF